MFITSTNKINNIVVDKKKSNKTFPTSSKRFFKYPQKYRISLWFYQIPGGKFSKIDINFRYKHRTNSKNSAYALFHLNNLLDLKGLLNSRFPLAFVFLLHIFCSFFLFLFFFFCIKRIFIEYSHCTQSVQTLFLVLPK